MSLLSVLIQKKYVYAFFFIQLTFGLSFLYIVTIWKFIIRAFMFHVRNDWIYYFVVSIIQLYEKENFGSVMNSMDNVYDNHRIQGIWIKSKALLLQKINYREILLMVKLYNEHLSRTWPSPLSAENQLVCPFKGMPPLWLFQKISRDKESLMSLHLWTIDDSHKVQFLLKCSSCCKKS